MASNIDKLRNDFEAAETKAQKLMAEKDDAVQKARDRYSDRLRQANEEAADAQKALNDAEAAEALLDHPNGEAIATSLGLTLPDNSNE